MVNFMAFKPIKGLTFCLMWLSRLSGICYSKKGILSIVDRKSQVNLISGSPYSSGTAVGTVLGCYLVG